MHLSGRGKKGEVRDLSKERKLITQGNACAKYTRADEVSKENVKLRDGLPLYVNVLPLTC